ncbi:MAG: hypothetical protein Ta2G_02250 [Termitinemataceae bacterium]|nr:MAG: hypothetical protein Ta2G_02250 [Termitinemataceae bacterium]
MNKTADASVIDNEVISETAFSHIFDCPLDHTPNAVTIAAIEECRAKREGKLPSQAMSFADFLKDLQI